MSKLGKMVIYTATKTDAHNHNTRRTDFTAHQKRTITLGGTPDPGEPGRSGHIGHLGNPIEVGQRYPAMIVRDWGGCVNLKVFLDGNDELWVTSSSEGDDPGQWVMP